MQTRHRRSVINCPVSRGVRHACPLRADSLDSRWEQTVPGRTKSSGAMRVFVRGIFSSFLFLVTWCHAQESASPATLTPGDNLIIQGIPPIPVTIAERANRYTEFRSAAVFSWHPQRREMLIGTRFADTVQIHEVKMPGGARTQLTFFPDRVSGASYHPHAGDYFVFSKDIGGGEWFQLYRYETGSRDIVLLTDGKSRNLGTTWSNRGDRIAYSSTRRNRGDLDFYVMNPADKSTDRLLVENQ